MARCLMGRSLRRDAAEETDMTALTEKAPAFWRRVATGSPEQCWEWQGALTHNGYGRFSPRIDGATVHVMAHRLALALHSEHEVPADLDVDHLCRNRSCCNPTHLEAVTHKVNVLRGESISAVNATKTECVDGHPFDADNTYFHPKRGTRICRACAARRAREYQGRKRRG